MLTDTARALLKDRGLHTKEDVLAETEHLLTRFQREENRPMIDMIARFQKKVLYSPVPTLTNDDESYRIDITNLYLALDRHVYRTLEVDEEGQLAKTKSVADADIVHTQVVYVPLETFAERNGIKPTTAKMYVGQAKYRSAKQSSEGWLIPETEIPGRGFQEGGFCWNNNTDIAELLEDYPDLKGRNQAWFRKAEDGEYEAVLGPRTILPLTNKERINLEMRLIKCPNTRNVKYMESIALKALTPVNEEVAA